MKRSLLREYMNQVMAEKPDSKLRFSVAGDVMFGRYVGYQYYPLEVKNPFSQVRQVFHNSDLSFVNLETPLFDGRPTWWKKYEMPKDYQKTLVAPTAKAIELANAGINLVSLANNHADDAGFEGFQTTQSALDKNMIIHAGTNLSGDPFEPSVFSIKGKDVVFFSVTFKRNFGSAWGNADEYPNPVAYIDNVTKFSKFLNMISFQRQMYPESFIITSVHWGEQYKSEVEVWQEVFAQEMVHAGVNCVLGHHPHVLRKFEFYKDALIFYSLGNLLFDHNYDIPGHASKKNARTMNGAIFTFEIEADNTISSLNKVRTTSTPSGILI